MDPNFSNDPVQSAPPPATGLSGNEKVMAIASLVIGVLNLCAWFLPICGIPLGLVGIVLGYFGMKDPTQKTLAIIGIALSGIGILLACGNSIFGVLMSSGAFDQFQF
jgi:hypothetical protein